MKSFQSLSNVFIAHFRPSKLDLCQKITFDIQSIYTWANLITMLRTMLGLVLFSLSLKLHEPVLNYLGLATYWILDALDGYLARRLNQETLIGAQMDIISDRLLVSFFYINYMIFNPSSIMAVVLFLFEFCALDLFLSNQFLRWPILSPNYFYFIDYKIWLINWSIPGKLINTLVFTVLLLTLPNPTAALVYAIFLILLKLHSSFLILHLPENVIK